MRDLPFKDTRDFENAGRGYRGGLSPAVVKSADGRVIWDNDAYDFLKADCPDTAHPGLWGQAQLGAKQGLYEVTEGICHGQRERLRGQRHDPPRDVHVRRPADPQVLGRLFGLLSDPPKDFPIVTP